jgi:hypothetical protein
VSARRVARSCQQSLPSTAVQRLCNVN